MANRELYLAERIIKFEEGLVLHPYYDTLGVPTIGFGHALGKPHDPLPNIVWTPQKAQEELEKKLKEGVKELSEFKATKDVWEALSGDTDRKALLISMWYQLGSPKLAGFKNTLKAITSKDWKMAAAEMLDSLVAQQAPKRWKRQASAMFSGNVSSTYNI